MVTVYLIRHAEAEGNVYRRAHGQFDGLLTNNGLAQLELLHERFKNVHVDAVYSSDLTRTLMTAEACAHGKPVRTDKRLREFGLGVWEDLPWGELMVKQPDAYRLFTENDVNFEVENSERFEQVIKRSAETVGEIVASHKDGDAIVIVSHGAVIGCLLFMLLNDGSVHHVDNASITTLETFVERGQLFAKAVKISENDFLGDLSTLKKQTWWRKDGKDTDVNLWFKPATSASDFETVNTMQADAWLRVYGTMEGYDSLYSARKVQDLSKNNEKSVQLAMSMGNPVGFIIVDVSDTSVDYGHISVISLNEEFTGKGLGVQLIGEAVSLCRKAGKKLLRLRVFHKNNRAIAFYKKYGFVKTGEHEGIHGHLEVMMKSIVKNYDIVK